MSFQGKYIFRLPDHVAGLLRKLHPAIKANLKRALQFISEDPFCGKALKDELAGLRSYRVKRYRIIYRLMEKDNILEIIAIGPRKSIYEETFRLISRQRSRLSS